MSPENKRANAAAEMLRADESLRAASILAREGLCNDSISDAYYAAFHAVRALLFTLGQEPRSHRALVHLFNVGFVLSGKLDARYLSVLARAQYDRTAADYGGTRRFTREEAESVLASARELVEKARELLGGQ